MAATAAPRTNGTGPEKPPRDVTSQVSYSGTPRGRDGLASPDDYVRELSDLPNRMELFEEMGKSDDAIGNAVATRLLEILQSNWQVTSAAEDDLGTEILEFVQDNLYPHIERILRILGKNPPQYGFGVFEPVFAWSDEPFFTSISRGDVQRPARIAGERRIYLRRIAHIRPTAVTAFRIDENGELLSLHQQVFDGTRFRDVDVPARKLVLRVYDQEGDDYSGNPAIRHLYKAYTFKRQIERLTVLHFDKFGVGVPVIIEPPGGYTPAERSLALSAAKAWRSGGENALTMPNGGDVKIVTGEGSLASSGLEWNRHYNQQTSQAFATQQQQLGTTATGSRAVGETFAEQLGGASQSDCEEIAAILNDVLIVPLVKWNFGTQDVYPVFNPSQRAKGGSTDAAAVQAFVTAGMLHPRPEDEAEVRDRLELPPVKPEVLAAEAKEREAKAAEIAKQTAAAAGGKPGDDGTQQPPKPPLKVAATREPDASVRMLAIIPRADGAPAPAVKGDTSYRSREFAMWEQQILRPDLLVPRLDMETTRLAAEVQDTFAAIDKDLERQADVAAANGPEGLHASVSTIVVPEKLKKQLRAALTDAGARMRDFGASAVRSEVLRQLAPENVGPARNSDPMGFYTRNRDGIRQLAARDEAPSLFDLHLAAEVDRVVENEIDRREAAARDSVLTAIASWTAAAAAAGVSLASVVLSLIRQKLGDLSVYRTEDSVRGVVNVAFGIGRTEEAQAINTAAGAVIPAAEKSGIVPSSSVASPPAGSRSPAGSRAGGGAGNRSGLVDAEGNPIVLVAKVASAVMDFGTCDECAKWDGAQFPIDYPEDVTGVQCPNPRCYGGIDKCRCIWIYLTSLEDVPLVPAAKGPLGA